jgi:hypothetical protein
MVFSTFAFSLFVRLAHALASSFNFQGRVRKTFFVLTDDKVGAGPRLRPQALLKPAETDPAQPMEIDGSTSQPVPTSRQPAPELTLAAKLAAAKRKASEAADAPATAKARR